MTFALKTDRTFSFVKVKCVYASENQVIEISSDKIKKTVQMAENVVKSTCESSWKEYDDTDR